jgi:hypothetical protein
MRAGWYEAPSSYHRIVGAVQAARQCHEQLSAEIRVEPDSGTRRCARGERNYRDTLQNPYLSPGLTTTKRATLFHR